MTPKVSVTTSGGGKPAWADALISVGTCCAVLALLAVMVVGTQQPIVLSSAGAGSLAPCAGDASKELEGAGPVSAGFVSKLGDGERTILDDLGQPDSFENMPLHLKIAPFLLGILRRQTVELSFLLEIRWSRRWPWASVNGLDGDWQEGASGDGLDETWQEVPCTHCARVTQPELSLASGNRMIAAARRAVTRSWQPVSLERV